MLRSFPPLLVAVTLLCVNGTSALDSQELTPRVGETVREFEARKRGLKPDPDGPVVITVAADRSGHFYVDPVLDGWPMRMVVDTGASVVALTYEDAERVGARLSPRDFTLKMSTANGVVDGAPLRIGEIRMGEIAVRDVEAVILPRGRLAISLLGMSFLKRLQGFDISQGSLRLRN